MFLGYWKVLEIFLNKRVGTLLLCRVWSLKTGELVNTLQHHSEAVLHLRFADGIMVTCSKVCTSSQICTMLCCSLVCCVFELTINITLK